VLQGATHRTPPAGARLAVTLELRGVALAEAPTALLELRLENVGDLAETAADATVRGAGMVPTTVPLNRTVQPGAPEVVPLRVPLSCTRGHRPGDLAEAAVRLGAAGPGAPTAPERTTVQALPVGALGAPGGLCSTADATLPNGWAEPATAADRSFAADRSLRVTVTGLPADVTDVVGADADGVLVAVRDAPVAVRAGRVTLVLDPPPPGCRPADGRPVVPTGVQLLVQGGDGLRFSYLAMGADVAAWLAPAVSGSCPDGPIAASTVRPDFPVPSAS
jgi:hypothetical protein